MKKFLFIGLFLAASFAFGQSLQVLYEGEVVNSGDTIDVNLTQYTPEVVLDFDIVNTTNEAINAMAARENIDVVVGSSNYFCFELCVDASADTCAYPVEIAANDTMKSIFNTHYEPRGYTGTSVIKYSIFVEDSINDIVAYYVRYNSAVGIKNNVITNVALNAYPNPASENVTISYSLPQNGHSSMLVIKNMVGKTVKVESVSASSEKMNVNISDLSSGVYFYSLEQDNRPLMTKKLIVK